ncbi:MAG: hypothetical protein ACJAVI_001973 [Candidatus Azotimanducaceae bacterium]|jgi:hypothetical protein
MNVILAPVFGYIIIGFVLVGSVYYYIASHYLYPKSGSNE